MVKIILHGSLAEYGPTFNLDVKTPREAERVIISHLKRLAPEKYVKGASLQFLGVDSAESMDSPITSDSLEVMPAFVVGGPLAAFIPIIIKAVVTVAVSFAIGAVINMLSPVPTLDTIPEDTNPEASKYISGTSNTTKIGTRIPLAYGTFPIYGQFLSINIQSKDISTGPYSAANDSNSPFDSQFRFGRLAGTSINVY